MLLKDLLRRAVKSLHRRLADYVGKEHQKGRRTCSTIIFFSYFFGSKKGAPHAARLLFFIQRIKSLICGVAVAHYPGAGNSQIPAVCPRGGGGGVLKFRFDRSISDASFETSRPHPLPSSPYFQENCAEDFFSCHIIIITVITTTLNIIKG